MTSSKLIRFKCRENASCSLKNTCSELPIEIHRNKNEPVDILFVSEFPDLTETKESTPFIGKFMGICRNCISFLHKKYDFSYAMTALCKSRKFRKDEKPFTNSEVNFCAKNCFSQELEATQPKLIVAMGSIVETYLTGVENPEYMQSCGALRKSIPILGREWNFVTSIHPVKVFAWSEDDSNVAGMLYSSIEKAILRTKGWDFNIPTKFTSKLISSIEELKIVLRKMLKTPEFVAVDTETCNLNRVYENRILSLQLSQDGKTGYVIPLYHFDSPFIGEDLEIVKDLIVKFLTFNKSKVLGYVFVNAKFDYHQIFRDFHVFQFNAPIIDCSYAEFSLDENLTRFRGIYGSKHGPYSLYTLSLSRGFLWYRDTGSKERRDILEKLPLKEWQDYAGADAVVTFNVWKSQLKQAEATGFLEQFKKATIILYNHIVRVITYTEHCGLAVSPEVLRELNNPRTSVTLKSMSDIIIEMNNMPSVKKLNALEQGTSLGMGTGFLGSVNSFNPQKRLQLEKLFFDILGLEPLGEKKSVDKNFQNAYKNTVPEAAKLAEYNEISTLHKMFVAPIYNMVTPGAPDCRVDFYTDNRIRPTFRTDAVTSRLRCTSPNLQQRPSRGSRIGPILSMYSCKPGRAIVKCDFSTFEVRGLGFISRDQNMIDLFSEMHNIKEEFRKDPEVFAKEGYESRVKAFSKEKEELLKAERAVNLMSGKEKEKAMSDLKDKNNLLEKNISALNEQYENDPISLSMEVRKWKTDFHRRSAALFNNIDIADVSKAQRQNAKGFVFGCFTGDTIVGTEKGPMRLKSVEEGTSVISVGGRVKPSDGAVSRGVKPIVQVLTRRSLLKGTSGHKVMCLLPNCTVTMKPLGELKKGDYIIYQTGTFGSKIPDPEKLKIFSKVPSEVLIAPKKYVAKYLRRCFDKKGTIIKMPNGKYQISLSSKNKEFTYDIAYLLEMFDISSPIYKIYKETYKIIISSSISIRTFYEKIGFKNPEKKDKLDTCVKGIENFLRTPGEKLQTPFTLSSLKDLFFEKAGIGHFRSKNIFSKDGTQLKSFISLRSLIENINEYKESFFSIGLEKQWKTLKLLGQKGCKISPVFEEASDCGEEEVFDILNVEKFHKWTANGIIVSNSIYGRGEQSIATELGITVDEAMEIKKKFQNNMPNATKWLEEQAMLGRSNLYVESPLGTVRHLWGYLFNDKAFNSKMDRLAQNSIIQGMCSNMNLVGCSHLIKFIHKCHKAKYQTSEEKAWFITNLIHDSCEMEVPIEDAYFVTRFFERFFTSQLERDIKEQFGFEIKIPLEVDFTLAHTYADTKDWDGSKVHLKKLFKWLVEECGKRDGQDYSDLYKIGIKKKLSDYINKDK